MKKKNSLSLTMTAVVVLCAVVVLITGLIGFVLSSQSSDALRTLINERMLDISNTAADMLDGDALAGLTAGDVDTPAYREGMRILRTFYDNIELEFIYCIYDRGNGLYVFGIDPSDDPGTFEDPVITTPALVAAFDGVTGKLTRMPGASFTVPTARSLPRMEKSPAWWPWILTRTGTTTG